MQHNRKQLYRIVFALLIATTLLSLGCDGGNGDNEGNGDTDLIGTWNGTFIDIEPGGEGIDNGASMIINYQDESGFSGTATVYTNPYIVGGSVDEQTGEIGMFLTPTLGGIKIAMAASPLSGDVLSGEWANPDPPLDNHGTFSLTRQ